jgi:hypothetical protein
VALAALAILLVARLAQRLVPGAGAPAALLYALAPWEAVTAARSLPESAAWLLALGAANLLLAPPDERRAWPWLGGVLLALACLFRYEAWLLAALFAARAARRWHVREELAPLAPAGAVIGSWTLATSGLFVPRILAQGRAEASYHETVGLHPAAPLLRAAGFGGFLLASLGVVAALALVAALLRPRRFVVLVPVVFALAVLGLVAASASDGSPRYLGMATPFLCVLAGEAVALAPRLSWGAALLAVALVAQAPLTAGALATESRNAVYEAPQLRAGAWIAAHPPSPRSLVMSESPDAAFASGVDAARLVGANALPDDRAAALAQMRAESVALVVYVNDSIEKFPYLKLDALFPELGRGASTRDFTLVDDPNGWEMQYGARPVFVYEVVPSP